MWKGASPAATCEYAVSLMLAVHSSSCKWYNASLCMYVLAHACSKLKTHWSCQPPAVDSNPIENHYRPLCALCNYDNRSKCS